MANYFTEQRLVDNNKRALIKFVFTSDGSVVSNTTLVDVSSLALARNTNGYVMSSNTDQKALYRTTIKRIFGMAKANGHFKVQWQGTNNNSIVHITTGQFDYDFQSMGDGAVVQNTEAGTNGDIVFSTVGQTQPDTFTLFIDLRKDSGDYDAGQTNDPIAFNRGRAAGP